MVKMVFLRSGWFSSYLLFYLLFFVGDIIFIWYHAVAASSHAVLRVLFLQVSLYFFFRVHGVMYSSYWLLYVWRRHTARQSWGGA